MARREFDLKSLLDIPLWEKVQDELAKLTGTAIITVDFKGNPITKHSGRTEFCSVIRENPVSRKRCYRCDSLAGLEAVRLGRPYIYLCHCGIVDVAVPVLVGDRYLGAVMFGEVRLPKNAEAEAKVERLVSEISSFQAESRNARSDLLEMYERLPEMEYASIVQVADTINAMVNYIIDRAVNRENEVMTYEYLLHGTGGPTSGAQREIEELRMPRAGAARGGRAAVQEQPGVSGGGVCAGAHAGDGEDGGHGAPVPPEPELFFACVSPGDGRELYKLDEPAEDRGGQAPPARGQRDGESDSARAWLHGPELLHQRLPAL